MAMATCHINIEPRGRSAGGAMGNGVDFALTTDQEMLKALVERFVADRYAGTAAIAARAHPAGYDATNWALLGEIGLLALPFAEQHGGLSGGAVEIATVAEAFGRGLVAEPYLNEIIVAGRLLQAAGTEAQQASWLPGVVAGTSHMALAHAEHDTRHDLDRCRTSFDNGALTGGKTFAPAGADAYIVTARRQAGIGLCLVRGDAAGLASRSYRLVDGALACELQFEGAAAEPMPGSLADLQEVVATARIAACAEMLGLMALLFDTTLDYVRQRRQFGVPIGSFQAIQHRLADLYVSLELSRSHLFRCILAVEEPYAVAAAKSYISMAAIRLGEACIQFHGGMGVSDELLIGHAHKRILVLATLFGDADDELECYNRAVA